MATYRVRVVAGAFQLDVAAESTEELLEGVGKLDPAVVEELRGSMLTLLTEARGPQPSTTDQTATSSGEREDLVEIVNAIRSSQDFPRIEQQILDNRAELPRVLLAVCFASKATSDPYLSAPQIETITSELGVRIRANNVRGLMRGRASRYFLPDRVRGARATIRYRVNRAGEQEFARLLEGSS